MDVNSTVKVDRQKLPPFNVHLYGPLDNIQRKVDAKALKQYLVENVLTKVIDKIQGGKGGAGDILKNIIGGSSQQAAPSPKDNPDNNNGTENLIKKGLGNLFK